MTLRRPLGDSWSPEVANTRFLFVLTFFDQDLCVHFGTHLVSSRVYFRRTKRGSLERAGIEYEKHDVWTLADPLKRAGACQHNSNFFFLDPPGTTVGLISGSRLSQTSQLYCFGRNFSRSVSRVEFRKPWTTIFAHYFPESPGPWDPGYIYIYISHQI